ncbi:MAG: dihydrodipicolinate synthase family protein [Candidatus Atribacteria bacterium]|nr:dihydrodipicolinate synthase family protein [Candidatus Atribacteria bacterium]
MKKLYGVITAMTTPFDENNKVDVTAINDLTEFLISKGVHCLYPTGTTGEMYLMSPEERELVAETVVKKAAGRVTVFIHVGAMTITETIRLAQQAKKIGADGIGVVTPSYFTVNDKAMEEYYVEVANSVPADFPVYLYAIPQCAANDIMPEVAQKIANRCKNVVGIKYSFADMLRVKDYLNINDGDFSVVVGTDRLFYPALCMGCDGTVSGVSDPMPEHFVEVYNSYKANDEKKAREEQKIASEICEILKSGADMALFKTTLDFRGIRGGHMRKPLINLTEDQKSKLYSRIKKYL